MALAQQLWFIPIGFAVGAYGTLIGAGGGFVLMPVLLLLYPRQSPELLSSISLAVVFLNALSGSAAYAYQRRIDYRSGVMFSVAAVPGAILGALTSPFIPRRIFDLVFGIVLIAGSVALAVRPQRRETQIKIEGIGIVVRRIMDRNGVVSTYVFPPLPGILLSLFVGYLSSLLGIGGGIIHVPILANLLHFPVHIATATSHFVLAVTALAGTITHVAAGVFAQGLNRVLLLGIGVVGGAQLGAYLSPRIHGKWIMRGLALALGIVGVRILAGAI